MSLRPVVVHVGQRDQQPIKGMPTQLLRYSLVYPATTEPQSFITALAWLTVPDR